MDTAAFDTEPDAAVDLGDPQRWSWREDGLSLFPVANGIRSVDLTDGILACTVAA